MELTWALIGLGAGALCVALLLGGQEERIVGAARAASTLCSALIGTQSPTEAVVRDVAINLALLAVVLPLALKSSKAWPLAAASLCLAALMTAAAQTLVHAAPQAYGILQGVWALMSDCAVAVGAWNARRARRGA
jgi:hypothetical protein